MYAMRLSMVLAVGIMTRAQAKKYFCMMRALTSDWSVRSSKNLEQVTVFAPREGVSQSNMVTFGCVRT